MVLRRIPQFLAACALLVAAAPAKADSAPVLERVGFAVRHDTSPPLREMALPPPVRPGVDREVPIRVPADLPARVRPTAPAPDALRQSEARPFEISGPTPPPSLSFRGLSDDDNALVNGFRIVPPDTEGDVGPSHYVQYVNLLWAVYDKATGAIVPGGGPFPGNSFWQGFGGICETNNDGDPIVLYDHLADRWMVSQFAIGSNGHQCIAVSATGDPLGSYHRYDFAVSPDSGGFNDYPKLGLWPDAYYLTANEFIGSPFVGAIAVAFERDQMLAGQPAQFVKFLLPCGSECFFSVQPSHLEGPAPAPGTPNTFVMAFDDETWGTGSAPDGYRLWEFAVNWASPASSTFTSLGQLNTTEFDANLCNFSACVPQPRPGETLDSLSQFTMYRAQHREFGTHASIVLNHTVDVNGANLAGIRWVELRNSGSGWSLYQSGTYSPADGLHRWMASIAMDEAGDIALAYSVSSGSARPSIRYATRTAADPLGTLPGGEVELIAGAGVQRSSSNRWGDYSTVSVDPADNCTFWITNEYYEASGSFDFNTRVGAFVLPECRTVVCGDGSCDAGEDSCNCAADCGPPPGSEVGLCADGLDNDCDLFADCDDADCGGDPACQGCDLGQTGDPCVVNADCCSNKCKGPPGGKTCR